MTIGITKYIRIKIFSNFCDSSICKEHYERICDVTKIPYYGVNKPLYITTGEDYTHVIILNTAMPAIKHNISKENVIGLAFEPPPYLELTPKFILYAERYIGKYFIGDRNNNNNSNILLPELFKEHYSFMWHITPLSYIPTKNKVMSIMVSEKRFSPGHRYRHKLVQGILDAKFPIDIYGNGTGYYPRDPRIKGEFKEKEPYEHYDFHICIENFSTNAYFSEKITNTLLCSSTPIYWGCKNILNYFPDNVITLTGKIELDMITLRDILINPIKYKTKINVELIKYRLNLLRNVEKIFVL